MTNLFLQEIPLIRILFSQEPASREPIQLLREADLGADRPEPRWLDSAERFVLWYGQVSAGPMPKIPRHHAASGWQRNAHSVRPTTNGRERKEYHSYECLRRRRSLRERPHAKLPAPSSLPERKELLHLALQAVPHR